MELHFALILILVVQSDRNYAGTYAKIWTDVIVTAQITATWYFLKIWILSATQWSGVTPHHNSWFLQHAQENFDGIPIWH